MSSAQSSFPNTERSSLLHFDPQINRNYHTLTDQQPQKNDCSDENYTTTTVDEGCNDNPTHSANVSIASTLNDGGNRQSSKRLESIAHSIFSHNFWQEMLQNLQKCSTSIYLENKGSVARDHLANERTYLAWVRTSLSTVSVGIGLTQLFRLEKSATPDSDEQPLLVTGQMIGFLFIIISMVFLIFAFLRFFHAQVAMMKGFFPATRSTVMAASCILFLTMFGMLIIVVKQSC